MRRILLCVAALLIAAADGPAPPVEPIAIDKAGTLVPAEALGGTLVVVKYQIASPDQTVVGLLLLGRKEGFFPFEVPLLDLHGTPAAVRLTETAGATCVLSQVRLFRAGRGIVLVAAHRLFGPGAPLPPQPGPMGVDLLLLSVGDGQPGSPPWVWRPSLSMRVTSRPICTAREVEDFQRAIAQGWRQGLLRRPGPGQPL